MQIYKYEIPKMCTTSKHVYLEARKRDASPKHTNGLLIQKIYVIIRPTNCTCTYVGLCFIGSGTFIKRVIWRLINFDQS